MDKNSTLGKSQSIIFIIAFLIVLLITVGVQEAYEWNIEQITERLEKTLKELELQNSELKKHHKKMKHKKDKDHDHDHDHDHNHN